jgi:hypothetical protein
VSVLPPDAAAQEAAQGRHRSIQDAVRWFHDGSHLPEPAASVSRLYAALAADLLALVDVDDPSLTRALNDLLDSKDAAVRAALVAGDTPRS